MLENLKKSLDECLIIEMKGYQYFIHPLTDGIYRMNPELLNETADVLIAKGDLNCDVLLAPETMGIPLTVLISQKTGIPMSIIRKRQYHLPGEISIAQYTGYSKSDMFINGIKKGDRVVIIDDVLSTGGTIRAIINALKNTIEADIVDILVVFEKTKNKADIEKEFGQRIKTLLKIDIINGKVVYKDV